MKVIDGGFCSNCYNHVLDQRCVEFDAAWDGPVVEGLSIDELRLCESCVNAAANLLTIDPQAITDAENAALEAEKKADEWRKYALELEKQIAGRPEPLKRTGKVKQPA